MTFLPSWILRIVAVLLSTIAMGCDERGAVAQAIEQLTGADAQTDTASTASPAANIVVDKPIESWRIELLDLAFETASAFPLEPHGKNRSRAQEEVVAACLRLDQPLRAVAFADKIVDWRRGSAYADFAFYCVRNGDTSRVGHSLNVAAKIADSEEDWRRDQIRSKIAMTYAWIGRQDLAAQYESGLVESESGRVAGARAMVVTDDQFEAQAGALDELIATGNFDLIKGALEAFTQLFNRFYDQPERRTQIERKIKASWSRMPYLIRVELLEMMAGFALDHRDASHALALIDETQSLVKGFQWDAEDRVALTARLAGLRARAGDVESARLQTNSALAMFSADRESIFDIYRGKALRPIAEAYQSMGDAANATVVYRMAVDEAVENPNSRPRANDLTATCCSMAMCGVEPDAELWARLRKIREELGDPW